MRKSKVERAEKMIKRVKGTPEQMIQERAEQMVLERNKIQVQALFMYMMNMTVTEFFTKDGIATCEEEKALIKFGEKLYKEYGGKESEVVVEVE